MQHTLQANIAATNSPKSNYYCCENIHNALHHNNNVTKSFSNEGDLSLWKSLVPKTLRKQNLPIGPSLKQQLPDEQRTLLKFQGPIPD